MKRKANITERDVALLLRRYSATTVLALLHEVTKCASAKIDWNSLVKNTATGITNAREYQMLWRHLAYRETLAEKYEDDAQLLDDDSDLDFEIEPLPAVGSEALSEAAACVKVLATSGTPNNAGLPSHSTLEAPLTINIPSNTKISDVELNNQQSTISTQGMNITVPVSIQKQPTVSSSEGIDGNVSANSAQPVRKKRKLWTTEEDKELIAAVQKCGEGNWSSILKGAFKHDRTASQLSQRWSLIRKRQGVSNQGNLGNSSTLSATLDATQSIAQAVPVAISTMAGVAVTTTAVTANSAGATAAMTSCSSLVQPMALTGMGTSFTQSTAGTVSDNSASQLHQAQHVHDQGIVRGSTSSSNVSATLPSSTKSRHTTKKHATKTAASFPSMSSGPGRCGNTPASRPGTSEALSRGSIKTLSGPHPMVQAAAVAAGARIAPASAAASLFKAAQSGNAVHIGHGGVSLVKSVHATQAGSIGGGSTRASNVHYIRSGSVLSPPVSSGTVSSVQRLPATQVKIHTGRAATAGQTVPHVFRTNLPPSTLPATQALGSSSASQSQALNQTNQGNCCPSISALGQTSRVKLKSQAAPFVSEASTVQSQTAAHSKSVAIDSSFSVPSAPVAAANAGQVSTEKAASRLPNASILPLAVEISSGASNSLCASKSVSCPVIGPCELTDVPTNLTSISGFSDNIIMNEGAKVQEGKISGMEKNHSLITINKSCQHGACSERNAFSENEVGIECSTVETNTEVHCENNIEISVETTSMPRSPAAAPQQNVSILAQNDFSNDTSFHIEK